MKEKFLKLCQNGDIRIVELDADFLCEEFRRELDCGGFEAPQIREFSDLSDVFLLIVDDLGRYQERNYQNLLAGYLYGNFLNGIVGDALVAKAGIRNGEPDIVGLTDEDLANVFRKLDTVSGFRAESDLVPWYE